jgi:GAF domain-containing protein
MLAIPIVNQHVLNAVVLYGAHANHTLLDPDEVELLHQLAKAAATSHQQVRIATLTREIAALTAANSALTREYSVEKLRNDRLEGSLRTLVLERGAGER